MLLSYIGMVILLALQYVSNKHLAKLLFTLKEKSDSRFQYLSQVLSGIRSIKLNLHESVFLKKINAIRSEELSLFSKYINIRNICAAIYSNSAILISSMIFLFADKQSLELGKVFSTLALLGYIFNFSVLYSNYAIEAVYTLKVFDKRITEIVDTCKAKQALSKSMVVDATIIDEDDDPLATFPSFEKMQSMK